MQENKKKVKSKKRHLFLWFLLTAAFGILLLFLFYWKTDFVSKSVEKYLNRSFAAQGVISYKSISGNLINEFIIRSINVDLNNGNCFSAREIRLQYNLFSIISGDLNVKSIAIDSLVVCFAAQDSGASQENLRQKSSFFSFINALKPQTILKNIPDFSLDGLHIVNASLMFSGRLLSFNHINLSLSGKKEKDNFVAKISKLEGRWFEKNINIVNTSAAVRISNKRIQINDLKINSQKSFAELDLTFTGGDSANIRCAVRKFGFNFDEWGMPSFKKDKKAGYITGDFIVNGDSSAMRVMGALKGRLAGYVVDNLTLDADIEPHKIDFKSLLLKTQGQRVFYRGYYGFNKEISGRFDFNNINIKKTIDKGVATELNGYLNIVLNLQKKEKIKGGFDLNIYGSRIAALQIDSLHFAALLDNGVYSIVEPSFLKLAADSRFTISGNIADSLISLSLETRNNSLKALGAAVGIDSLEGVFSGKLNLGGRLFDPDLAAKINMPFFEYKKIRFDSTGFDMKIKNMVSKRSGKAFFKIHNGMVYDLPIDDITVNAQYENNVFRFPVLSFLSNDNYIDAQLYYFIRKDTSGVIIEHFKGRYKNYWLENVERIELYITQNSFALDNFHLIGPGNSTIRAAGAYNRKEDESEIYLSLHKIALKPFENFWGKRFELKGVVNGSIDIINPQKNIELNTNVRVDSLNYEGVPIGDINSSFVYYNRNFYLNELRLNYGKSQLSVTGDLAFTLDSAKQLSVLRESKTNVKIGWKDINMAQYAPLLQNTTQIKGATSGYFEIHGTIANPMIRHHVTLSDFKYNNFIISSAELFAQYNSGYVIIDSLDLNLNGSEFDIKGWQAFQLDFMKADTAFKDRPFNLFVHSVGDSMTFLKEINDQVYAIYGPYKLELNIGGTLKRPGIESGFIDLKNGEILLSRVLDPVKDVNIHADISDSLLAITHFVGSTTTPKDLLEKGWDWFVSILPWTKGEEDKGVINIAGNIDFSNVLSPRYDLNIFLDNFYIDYFLNNTRLVLKSDSIMISGRDTLYIIGKIEIADGEYIVDMDQIQKNIYLSTPQTEQSYPLIDEDLEISIPSDFIISSASASLSNNFKIAINGDLRIIKPAGENNQQISGLIMTTSGKYSAWNQTFEINTGEILFDSPNAINPRISIRAVKIVKDRTFDLTISGRLDELEQRIKVTKDGRELNLSDSDKLTMLTFGTDVSGLASNADSTMRNVGGDVATRALLNVMERGAENLTGLDRISVNTEESLIDFQKMKLNNGLKDASISFGKYITGDLYLEYRTKFAENFPAPNIGWHAGNRIFLEYRLYKRLKVDSFYEATQAGKMRIQLGISWQYDF